MANFNSYDSILAALEAGKGQEIYSTKVAPAAQAAGAYYSTWAYTGDPGAGSWQGTGGASAATMGVCYNTTTGALPLVSPTTASGENLRLLTAGIMSSTSIAGTAVLIDRIADTGPLATTAGGSCSITMPVGGWPRYTNGVGVVAFVESLAAVPTSGTAVTLNYTNTNSVSGRVSSTVTVAAASHRVFGNPGPFISPQAGDTGIKSIESISIATASALNIAVVVCKPLFVMPLTTAFYYTERDLVIQTPKLPRLPVSADSTSCLQWIIYSNAATTPVITSTISAVAG